MEGHPAEVVSAGFVALALLLYIYLFISFKKKLSFYK